MHGMHEMGERFAEGEKLLLHCPVFPIGIFPARVARDVDDVVMAGAHKVFHFGETRLVVGDELVYASRKPAEGLSVAGERQFHVIVAYLPQARKEVAELVGLEHE